MSSLDAVAAFEAGSLLVLFYVNPVAIPACVFRVPVSRYNSRALNKPVWVLSHLIGKGERNGGGQTPPIK